MKRYLIHLSIALLAILLYSCGTMNLGSNIKKLEMGMTKKEVVNILGNDYKVIGAAETYEGSVETIKYYSAMTYDDYVIRFLNGKLVEWFIDNTRSVNDREHPPM